MKLHLPKLLFVAVAGLSVACAADYEVGTHTGGNNLPSKEANYKVYSGDLTLTGADRMGTFDSSGNLLTDSNFGTENWSYNWGKLKQNSAGTVTKNVQVTGTLSLNGSAQVSLGGQYKSSTDIANLGSADEFTGLIVNNLEVNDQAKLNTWNAIADTMTVNGGTVNIHTYRGEGNLGLRLEGARDSKQVQIKQALNVYGGNVTIGNAGYINSTNKDAEATQNPETEFHTVVSFGSFSYTGNPTIAGNYIIGVDSYNINSSKITQSNGNLTVAGKSLSIGGLNIEQTGGTMEISKNTYHFLSDYGDSEIKQSGGTMTLGCLKAYNTYYDSVVTSLKENGQTAEINPSVAITQDGGGVMNLNGVIFTNQKTGAASTEKSSIIQSGGGEINLGGEYKGVTFDITQEGKGGTLNINGSLAADVVNQDNNGSIVVAKDKTLSANTVNAGVLTYEKQNVEGKEVNVVTGGSVEMNGLALTNGTLSSEGSTVTNTGTLNAGKIVVNNGVFVNKGVIDALETPQDAASIMLAGSGVVETDALITIGEDGEFVNEGVVKKSILVAGGTLTLTNVDGKASTAQDVTVNSGTMYVTGNSTVASLTLNADAVLNVTAGAMVTLTEDDGLNIADGATIMVTVSTETLENLAAGQEFTLFSDNVSNVTNATIIFTDNNEATQDKKADISLGSTSGSIKIEGTVAVPEPTTATLSLLALAGLAMRRRRK